MKRMDSVAAGIVDHIAIVVHSIDDARKSYEEVLGGRFMYELERPGKGYRLCKIELQRVAFELLEPLGTDSFLPRGLHFTTLQSWRTDPDNLGLLGRVARQ